jgi:hypothetical protein
VILFTTLVLQPIDGRFRKNFSATQLRQHLHFKTQGRQACQTNDSQTCA